MQLLSLGCLEITRCDSCKAYCKVFLQRVSLTNDTTQRQLVHFNSRTKSYTRSSRTIDSSRRVGELIRDLIARDTPYSSTIQDITGRREAAARRRIRNAYTIRMKWSRFEEQVPRNLTFGAASRCPRLYPSVLSLSSHALFTASFSARRARKWSFVFTCVPRLRKIAEFRALSSRRTERCCSTKQHVIYSHKISLPTFYYYYTITFSVSFFFIPHKRNSGQFRGAVLLAAEGSRAEIWNTFRYYVEFWFSECCTLNYSA